MDFSAVYNILSMKHLFTAFSSLETGSQAVYSLIRIQMCCQSWISISMHLLQVSQRCRGNTCWPSLYDLAALSNNHKRVFTSWLTVNTHTHTCIHAHALHSRALEFTQTQRLLFSFSTPFTEQYFLFLLYVSLFPKRDEVCIWTQLCWIWNSGIGLLSQRLCVVAKKTPHGNN